MPAHRPSIFEEAKGLNALCSLVLCPARAGQQIARLHVLSTSTPNTKHPTVSGSPKRGENHKRLHDPCPLGGLQSGEEIKSGYITLAVFKTQKVGNVAA